MAGKHPIRKQRQFVRVCDCGCGQPTRIADEANESRGWIIGQPFRFLQGHSNRLKPITTTKYAEQGGKPKHVWIAEQVLGHPLLPGAVVHHVDEDTLNNANSNLVICQDKAYHMLLHVRMRVVRTGADPNTERLCWDCKRILPFAAFTMQSLLWRRSTGRCRTCHATALREPNRVRRERKRQDRMRQSEAQ